MDIMYQLQSNFPTNNVRSISYDEIKRIEHTVSNFLIKNGFEYATFQSIINILNYMLSSIVIINDNFNNLDDYFKLRFSNYIDITKHSNEAQRQELTSLLLDIFHSIPDYYNAKL